MFAVDAEGVLAGDDGSYAAFFLPFQDFSRSQHVASWTEQDGVLQFAALDVVVCAPGGACVDGDDPDDTVLPAGPITVTVTATIDSETPQGSSGTASGELLFAAADGDDDDPELPFTGAWLMEMAAWAAAAISIGALIVAMTRRDDTEEPVL